MKFGSVCSGIEAASVAWEPLGWRAAWLSEIEPFPCSVLAHHWPHVPNLGDMTTIRARILAGEVEAPDVFTGGTPCQAFSVAGKRGSLSDERGNLSLEFCEIADAIDYVRAARGEQPAIIIWENVPGVLSTGDNAFGCFLAGIAGDDQPLEPGPRPEPGRSSAHWTWKKDAGEHVPKWPDAGVAAGPRRTVAWRVLDAQYFGLAQRRRRVFVVASARNGFDAGAVLLEFDGVRRDSAPSRATRKDAPVGTLRSTDGGSDIDHGCAGHLRPVAGRMDAGSEPLCMAHGQGGAEIAENRSPTLTCNHEAPIVVYGAEGASSPDGGADHKHSRPAIPIQNATRGKSQNGLGVGSSSDPMYTLDQASQHAVCVTGDITHTLKADGFDGSEDGTGRGQPIVCVHGTQDPDTSIDVAHTVGRNRGQESVFAFDTTQITSPHNRSNPKPGGPCHTIPTSGHPPSTAMIPAGVCDGRRVATTKRVRRLTPLECERLQGMPDGWTLIPTDRRNRAMDSDMLAYLRQFMPDASDDELVRLCADGPRYKAIGNSWAVTCARWIGLRIDKQLKAANDNGGAA